MKLLTIAIPTYKRTNVLRKCIEAIGFGLSSDDANNVILIISDNDPDSENEKMLQTLRVPEQLEIRYTKNRENIGADANFLQCANLAGPSKYLWILGDDDIVIPGRISEILSNLSKDEYDAVYLETRPSYWGLFLPKSIFYVKDIKALTNFVNYHVTFVSAFILRLDGVKNHCRHSEKYIGTSLVHLSWVLPLLGTSKKVLVCPGKTLNVGSEATGNYPFGRVFVVNFWDLWVRFSVFFPDSIRKSVYSSCRKLMLLIFYPSVLTAIRRNSVKFTFDSEEMATVFKSEFSHDPLYWLSTANFFVLPKALVRVAQLILLGLASPSVIKIALNLRRVGQKPSSI